MWSIGVVSEVRRGEWCEDHYATLIIWGVTAHNPDGRRFAYVGPVETPNQLYSEALADRIRAYAGLNRKWTPVDNRHWNETDPVYGSEEYQRQGTEQQWADRERAEDPWFGEESETGFG